MVVLFIKDVIIRDNEFWKFICKFIYNFIKIRKYIIVGFLNCVVDNNKTVVTVWTGYVGADDLVAIV